MENVQGHTHRLKYMTGFSLLKHEYWRNFASGVLKFEWFSDTLQNLSLCMYFNKTLNSPGEISPDG